MSSSHYSLVLPRLFFGVGVDDYEDNAFSPLDVASGVKAIGGLLERGGYTSTVCVDGVTDEVAEAHLKEHLRQGSLERGALVVLWAGHGEPFDGGLRLITKNATRLDNATRTAEQLVRFAVSTKATQVLILLDTCYSGEALPKASEVIAALRNAFPDPAGWVGIVTSARSFEPARMGEFHSALLRVLTDGPRDPELRLRFHAFNAGVRGDDIIDAIKQEWEGSAQRPDGLGWGLPSTMFPNPMWNPRAREQVVEHLLLAAQGRSPDEEGHFFTGRTGPLKRVIDWLDRKTPGVLFVTGVAGCGKSAILGRIVSLSDASERAAIVKADFEGPDPGLGCIDAHVHARRQKLDDVARAIDEQLRQRGVLPQSQPRNCFELLGALQRQREEGRLKTPLAVAIDGLDEAGGEAALIVRDEEAALIASDLLRPLARFARILVGSRDIETATGNLVDAFATEPVLDLSAPEWAASTQEDVRAYVRARLSPVSKTTDPGAIADRILALNDQDHEGSFVLARVITSQLRSEPLDTGQKGWEAALATSVHAALDRELRAISGSAPCGVGGPQAARVLLTALCWGYGAGVPDDVWAAIAQALAGSDAEYTMDDVYWVQGVLGRYIVVAHGGGRANYRLSHQRLAQYLRPAVADAGQFASAVAIARALVGLYHRDLRSGIAPEAVSYLWSQAWRHCSAAGIRGIDELRTLVEANSAFLPSLGSALVDLGVSYGELGRPHDALPCLEEAVLIRRQLTLANASYAPDLALALNNLGQSYSAVGRWADALGPTGEAVDLYRQMTERSPVSVDGLARALNNLGVRYSEVGRWQDAFAATEEAVGLYRQLSQTNAGFVPELAMALNNFGVRYSAVGRRYDAFAVTEEALRLYRQLTQTNVAFERGVASTLTNLGFRYSELGLPDNAVVATEEAVELWRRLSQTNASSVPEFAKVLNNLGNCYAALGRSPDSLAPTEEAVELYRQLSKTNAAYIPELARALSNLGNRYSEVELRQQEALAPAEEAVDLYRQLSATNEAFLHELARALNNVGNRYYKVGHRAALAAAEEAVALYSRVSKTNAAFDHELANALITLARRHEF